MASSYQFTGARAGYPSRNPSGDTNQGDRQPAEHVRGHRQDAYPEYAGEDGFTQPHRAGRSARGKAGWSFEPKKLNQADSLRKGAVELTKTDSSRKTKYFLPEGF